MEQATNQTIETPKENMQKPDKKINTAIIVLLVLIILVLGIFIGYQLLKKNSKSVTETVTTTSQATTQGSTTPPNSAGTNNQTMQNSGSGTPTTVKPDIDGDLKTIDKLDLSGIENDYGEDQLSDL